MSRFIFCMAVLVLAMGCSQTIDKQKEGEKLMELSREWSRSVASNNMDKIMSYWADTAVFYSNHQPVLRGKDQIREMVESSSRIPGFSISWEPVSVSISDNGDMAYMIEKNKVTVHDSTGNPLVTYGHGVTIWKKDANGNWKNVVEIGVNDPPGKPGGE